MSIIYTGSTGPYIVKWNELLFSDNLHFRYSFISYALEVYSHWVFNWSVISSGKKINLSLYSHHCLPFIIMFIVRATSISCKEGRFPVNLWPGILSFRQGTKRYPSLKKSMPDGRSNSSGLIKWEKFSTDNGKVLSSKFVVFMLQTSLLMAKYFILGRPSRKLPSALPKSCVLIFIYGTFGLIYFVLHEAS